MKIVNDDHERQSNSRYDEASNEIIYMFLAEERLDVAREMLENVLYATREQRMPIRSITPYIDLALHEVRMCLTKVWTMRHELEAKAEVTDGPNHAEPEKAE